MRDTTTISQVQHRVWRWPRLRLWLGRGLIVSGVCALIGGGVLAAVIVRFGQRDRARPVDVIIALGGGIEGTVRRAEHAAALYHAGYAEHIICSGGGEDSFREADRCLWIVLNHGIPYEAVIREAVSLSTEENARAVAPIMAAHGWDSAILVTDDFHLWRATWLFRAKGLTVYPSPAQNTTGALPSGEKAYALCREVLATGWHVGKSMLGLPFTRTPLIVPRSSAGIFKHSR